MKSNTTNNGSAVSSLELFDCPEQVREEKAVLTRLNLCVCDCTIHTPDMAPSPKFLAETTTDCAREGYDTIPPSQNP